LPIGYLEPWHVEPIGVKRGPAGDSVIQVWPWCDPRVSLAISGQL